MEVSSIMAKADIMFDKTEFVLRMADKQAMTLDIRADQITTITFQPAEEKGGFLGLKKVDSEVMLIKMKGGRAMGAPGAPAGQGMPVLKTAFENKEKGSWDKMKQQMLKFAHDNNITLHEEKELWEPPQMQGGM